ncbi:MULTISPECIES: flagellar motor switch protein FliN [Salinibacter]|jgi:flagellar motor switch protein FliN/FliY|uniref:flagellar motor switch protein FliN n=1 Tax=Salinibacter TaxID=146918 RepID=UPI0021E7F030|nr:MULTISPECIES: flagellar motor switch protein FliN [Salinibacter]
MTQNTLKTHIQTALTALEALLEQLSGNDIPLDASAPKNIADRSPTEALQNDLKKRFVLYAADRGAVVALDPDWVPLFSEAMFGEEMAPDADGALDLMQEISSQGFGTVQSTLAEEGLTLPEVQFDTAAPGQAPPSPDEAAWLVPFTAQRDGGELDGLVLLPDGAEASSDASTTTESAPQEAAAGADQSSGASPPAGGGAPSSAADESEGVEVSPAAFSELGDEEISGDGDSGTFKLLADVDLEVRVELGRRELPLADVLKLTTGSVVELEKMVGEPLSVYANGRLIAEGEAVVIDEQFGVRITNLASDGHREKAFF